MTELEELGFFAGLALAGALHCAGMCGGFVVALAPASAGHLRRAVGRQLLFVLGKATTYAILGLALALALHALAHRGAELVGGAGARPSVWLEGARRASAWLAGLFLVLYGVGRLPRMRARAHALPARARRPLEALQHALRGVLALGGWSGPFGAGLVAGLLPCGLSWGALAYAAGRGPAVALLGMLAFGLATAPALLAVGLGWRGLAGSWRPLAARALGPLLILFGLWTAARGGWPGAPGSGGAPACCRQPAVGAVGP